MIEVIRPVRYGILMGLLGMLFGIGWAFWLVLGHEKIHESLDRAYEKKEEHSLFQLLGPSYALAHPGAKPKQEEAGHMHGNEGDHHEGTVPSPPAPLPVGEGGQRPGEGSVESGPSPSTNHFEGGHDNPIIDLSHRRLTRGHIHTMGLGLATIMISLVLTFTSAPDKVKTTMSILTGIGGIIYPLAWIVMGYRTPALGPDGADVSVRFIAGPGIALVLFGIFTAVVFLVKDIIEAK